MTEAERELLLMVADYLDKPVTQQRFTIRDLAAKVREEAEKPKVCTMPMPKDTDLLRSMGTDGIKWGIGLHDAIQAMYLIDIDADWLGSWFANAIEAGRSASGGHGSGAAEEPAQSCETCRYEAWPGYHHPCYGCVDGAKKPYQNWQPKPVVSAESDVTAAHFFTRDIPGVTDPETLRLDNAAREWLSKMDSMKDHFGGYDEIPWLLKKVGG